MLDSREVAKVRGTVCEGKEDVCKGVAKGEWKATGRRPCAKKRQGYGCHEGGLQEGCEKAKADNRWPCAREQAAERGETAEGCARPGKCLWSGDSLSLSPVGIE